MIRGHIALLSLILFAGGHQGERETQPAEDLAPVLALATQPPKLREISSIPRCAACSVALRPVADLLFPTDSISALSLSRPTRLANGSYVVRSVRGTPSPVLFDSAGAFVRVMAREGVGPAEVTHVSAVVRTPADSIWFVDRSRKLILSPDGDFVRQEAMPGGGQNFVVGPAGTVITAGAVGTPISAGYPLHIVDQKNSIVRSFGSTDPTLDPRVMAASGDDAMMALHRRFTPAGASTFWVYNDTRFLLELYDFDGRMLAQYRHALDGWYAEASRRAPSPGIFPGLALHVVQSSQRPGIVWLIYHDRRENYTPPVPGSRSDVMRWRTMHDLVVEAFDHGTGAVLATARFPQTLAIKVEYAPDVVALFHPVDDNYFTLRLASLTLQ